MATRAQEQIFTYVAWDTSANDYVTGDVANQTIMWIKNGIAATAAGTPAEVNSSFSPGVYRVTASPTETDCLVGAIAGKSTTAKVRIFGPQVAFEYIPAVSAGAAGGLPTLDANSLVRSLVAGVSAGVLINANMTQINGVTSVGSAGYVGVDWGTLVNKTTTNALTGTTISTSQVVGSVTGAVGSVTAGVLVGSVSAGAMAGQSISSVTGAVGSVTTPVTIGAVSAGAMSSVSISSVTGSVGSVTTPVTIGSVSAGAMSGVSISSVTGSVGSVTGSVTIGSVSAGAMAGVSITAVTGSVGSVTGAVTVGTINGTASNIKKNQALAGFQFIMTDSTTHAPKTGVTVTAVRSINGGAFAACANSATEISNGWYTIDLAASDLNGNTIALRMTGASADDRDLLIVTQI